MVVENNNVIDVLTLFEYTAKKMPKGISRANIKSFQKLACLYYYNVIDVNDKHSEKYIDPTELDVFGASLYIDSLSLNKVTEKEGNLVREYLVNKIFSHTGMSLSEYLNLDIEWRQSLIYNIRDMTSAEEGVISQLLGDM